MCSAAQPLKVLRCTKRPVSPSSAISAKPADKWAVNRVNSGHMHGPLFNYLAVNPAKRSRLCFTLLPPSARAPHNTPVTHVFSAHLIMTNTSVASSNFIHITSWIFIYTPLDLLSTHLTIRSLWSGAVMTCFCKLTRKVNVTKSQ